MKTRAVGLMAALVIALCSGCGTGSIETCKCGDLTPCAPLDLQGQDSVEDLTPEDDTSTEQDTGSCSTPDVDQTCYGCLIQGTCVPAGVHSQDQACSWCDPEVDDRDWSIPLGAPCSDGLFCTTDDRCTTTGCEGEELSCDDGVACNGQELCDESLKGCGSGQNQCGGGLICDWFGDQCLSTCSGCLVDEVCYAPGQVRPGEPCWICSPPDSTEAWTMNNGAVCDDGLFCTTGDTCQEGACVSGPQICGEGDLCFEDEARCCTPGKKLSCNDDGDVASFDSCGHEEGVVQDCDDLHGICYQGMCGCDSGLAGADCDRCVIYVDSNNGANSNDGSTWALAKAGIQAGVNAATQQGCDVWVRVGTYSNPVTMAALVGIYGGFLGDETTPLQRPAGSRSVLQGNNASNVVVGAAGGVLDGFIITGGVRGMNNPAQTQITVRNCIFEGNSGAAGAAMYNDQGSRVTISRCIFRNNSGAEGGALYNNKGEVLVESSLFSGNTASFGGGGMFNFDADVTVVNCTFHGNQSLSQNQTGGAIFNTYYSSVYLTNSIVWENLPNQFFSAQGSFVTPSHSDIQGGGNQPEAGNIDQDPMLDQGLMLLSGSPCIDRADDTAAPLKDLDGLCAVDDPVAANCQSAGTMDCGWIRDMGAYEYGGESCN